MKIEITKSSIKAEKEGFNAMPSLKDLKIIANESKLLLNPYDTQLEYWKNTYDTIVLFIPNIIEQAMALSKFVNGTRPDEVFFEKIAKGYIVRLWWD